MPDRICAKVERIIFTSDTFSVLSMKAREVLRGKSVTTKGQVFTAAGNVIEPRVGQLLEIEGEWTQHPKFGPQFKVVSAVGQMPEEESDIVAYLGSGMIKGIGPTTAKNIYDVFGSKTMDIIHNSPEELIKVKGVSQKKLEKIVEGCRAAVKYEEITKFLRPYGISLRRIKAIYELYGDKSVEKIKANPYQLAWELEGVGFKTADKIAYACGIKSDDPRRIMAGLEYVLETAANDGHTFLPVDDIDSKLLKLLELDTDHVSYDDIAKAIKGCIDNKHVVYEGENLYLTPYYEAEVAVAKKIRDLLSVPRRPFPVDIEKIEAEIGRTYAEQQRKVILDFPKNGITVLTGGPGTGKTTVVRGILAAFGRKEDVLLAAPTGRAAKKLADSTNYPASTIHRMLGAKARPGGGCQFEYNAANPLPCKLLIIDEVSMINIRLAKSLFEAIPSDAQVVLVGDADQLPAIGAGNLFRELISCGKVPVTKLDVLFRQGKDSNIIHNSVAINKGWPMKTHRFGEDFSMQIELDNEKLKQLTLEVYERALLENRPEDVQILTPRRRGCSTGANELNALIQSKVNPPSPGKKEMGVGERVFRPGDRVMQVKNDVEKGVFNGDTGTVAYIEFDSDEEADVMTVVMDDGRYVVYPKEDLEYLDLSYATTIHKSQGSEYRVVICPLSMQHYIMLKRNLLYTAITRAREKVILLGDPKAIAMAIRNNVEAMRYTKLGERI